MGSNMAEAHPVGFQWVIEAKARGARVIHVDPRFTRTSALADQHVTVRAGTDIAFLGGVINYILANNLEFREYVQAYTNAPFLVNEQYQDTEDLDGLFSGYDPHAAAYDRSSWSYESVVAESASGARHKEQSSPYQSGSGGPVLEGAAGELAGDPSLEHPRCVFQILKRHFARYTPEMVERICGVPRDLFLKVCRAWTENSGRERTAALVYSVGWTQHSVGPQYIRAGAIIQLLLGNIGRPGGGVYALRGHASIQGSTDIPTLFNLLPGYLPMPDTTHEDLPGYLDEVRGHNNKGFWSNADTYMISLLKEYWRNAATALFCSTMLVLVGRWAIIPTWTLFVILGNTSSGGAVAQPLLPPFYAFIGRFLPPGATVSIVRTAVYFRRDRHLEPFIVQAVWLVGTLAALLISARRLGRGPAQ